MTPTLITLSFHSLYQQNDKRVDFVVDTREGDRESESESKREWVEEKKRK